MSLEVILLPAVRTRAADALAAGFAATLARHYAAARLTLVELPGIDLADRAGVDALFDLHVLPALAAGRKPWLVGISLGAWLALLLASRHAREIAGVALIAPWLGTRELQREFVDAGGLPAWLRKLPAGAPVRPAPASLDEERNAWRFLAAPGALPVWLGYGEADRFRDAQSVAATLLPRERLYVAPAGQHDWPCWADIWEHFLRWLCP